VPTLVRVRVAAGPANGLAAGAVVLSLVAVAGTEAAARAAARCAALATRSLSRQAAACSGVSAARACALRTVSRCLSGRAHRQASHGAQCGVRRQPVAAACSRLRRSKGRSSVACGGHLPAPGRHRAWRLPAPGRQRQHGVRGMATAATVACARAGCARMQAGTERGRTFCARALAHATR
jgi:hypothetical protein